jgi:AcrR family transcriptional regulator
MGRLGPSRFTLAAVAKAVGLAPATLVQRFGSKRGLLLALAGPGAEDPTAGLLTRLRARFRSPLAQLRGFLAGFAVMAPSPDELANHLAFLQIDLTDPEFHRIALEAVQAVNP